MSRIAALKAWKTIRKTKTKEQIAEMYRKAAATRALKKGITPSLSTKQSNLSRTKAASKLAKSIKLKSVKAKGSEVIVVFVVPV